MGKAEIPVVIKVARGVGASASDEKFGSGGGTIIDKIATVELEEAAKAKSVPIVFGSENEAIFRYIEHGGIGSSVLDCIAGGFSCSVEWQFGEKPHGYVLA